MRIDSGLCVGCGVCLWYCPVGAIAQGPDGVTIFEDECVECGVCLRSARCPTEAIYEPEEASSWPRVIRKVFSDPVATHGDTGVRGRGTEEVKTNDVTGRFRRGQIGISLELGRPGVGTRLSEVEKVTTALSKAGVSFEQRNPLSGIMDPNTGAILPEVRNEKVLSILVEFTVPEERLPEVAQCILTVGSRVATAFTWGVICRFAPDGQLPVVRQLQELGLSLQPGAKINMGLGKPLTDD